MSAYCCDSLCLMFMPSSIPQLFQLKIHIISTDTVFFMAIASLITGCGRPRSN